MMDASYTSQKRCAQCMTTKSASEFRLYKTGNLSGNCKDCIREKQRNYNNAYAARNRHEIVRRQSAYKRAHREKPRAWCAVHVAVKTGVLVRPDTCQACGASGRKIEASHTDYSKMLDVEWLCPLCHRAKDVAMRRAAIAAMEGKS